MTGTITQLVAQEHVNDLLREAERRRRAAEVGRPRRIRIPLPRPLFRRAPRSATA